MSRVPVAVSRLRENDSRDAQVNRAVRWLLAQPGGDVLVVTPSSDPGYEGLKQLIKHPRVSHHAWRGHHAGAFDGLRVLYAWPDRKHLNEIWNAEADAIAVIEWNEDVTAEWRTDVNPIQLFAGETIEPQPQQDTELDRLPNGVDAILEHIAAMAAGYSSGLKWNEEDKLKADMMNRPERWVPVTVEQVRAKCRALGMKANDVDTIVDFVQRRKDGRRFNVRSSYRDFQFH